MENLTSFTALDFETMTGERSSACAIGLVKVVDGHIVNKFYSLINPISDNKDKDNTDIHGITREMVAVAPTFQQLWPMIEAIIGDDLIVCHNAGFDSSVWNSQMEYYRCTCDPMKYAFFCTYRATGLSLEDACKEAGIEIGTHHDALDDAIACAHVMLALNGCEFAPRKVTASSASGNGYKKSGYEGRKSYCAIEDSRVENKETPFFHANVVYTGTFAAFPDRNALGELLQSLGAEVKSGITSKIDIAIIGAGAGPSKLKKIEDLQAAGRNVRVMYEDELVSILSGLNE